MQSQSFSSASTESSTLDNKLTNEQKTTIRQILSVYDPRNFTEQDKASLLKKLKTAGICPSRELMHMLRDSDFDLLPPKSAYQANQTTEFEDTSANKVKELLRQYADIRPSKEVVQMLRDTSFELQPPRPLDQTSPIKVFDDSGTNKVEELFEKNKSGEITEDELQSQISLLLESLTSRTRNLIGGII